MKTNQLVAKIAFFTLLNLFSIASVANFNPLIVNGRPVKLGENYSKYTVGLGSTEIICTGVIIDKNHIVTAGHCFDDVRHGKVYFGTDKTNFVFRTIIDGTLHPDYCKNNCGTLTSKDDNDISIVKFDGDLPAGFEPVTLAQKSSLVSKISIHLAGFGANEHGGDYEDILKVAQAPFVELNGQSEFRTDETLAGSCNGDSGGPAFISVNNQLQLAGITSRGDGPCRKLGIYTIVSSFSKWIAEVAQH